MKKNIKLLYGFAFFDPFMIVIPLLLGSTLKVVSFSLLPLWSSYGGFLFYHLTMGIALSMISGGDVALL